MSQLKVVYTIPELAQAAGISRFRMSRLVRSSGVRISRSGRAMLLFLADLERTLPGLVDSLKRAEPPGKGS